MFDTKLLLNLKGGNSISTSIIKKDEVDHEYYSKDGNTVVFSGKIYNWQKTKNTADSQDFYASRLLSHLEIEGIKSITSLDGQFISIIDTSERTLVLRDYFGYGTQVYYNDKVFSNSLRLIKESGIIPFEPEIRSIARFLKEGYISAPDTAIKGLKKLKPGEYLEFRKSTQTLIVHSLMSYGDFSESAGSLKNSLQDAVAHYETLHRNSILKRINGNEEVGVLLSGGYDSGGNLSALRDLFKGKITAYSVGFEDNRWSELPFAAIMAEKFGAKHEVHILKENDIQALPEIVNQLGDPFFENGLMLNYKISKEIGLSNQGVILGGDGNDQIFGTSGRELALLSLSRKFGLGLAQKSIEYLTDRKSNLFRLGFHNKNIQQALNLKQFGFTDFELCKIFNQEFHDSIQTKNEADESEKLRDFTSLYVWRNYNTDIIESASQVIVYKASQLSNMHNLEVTFPYMDKEIFSFLQKLPRQFKMNGSVKDIALGKGQGKYLFKQYLKNKLPEEITTRKKQGGFAPLSIFMKDKTLRSRMYNFIERTFIDTGLFNTDEIKHFIASVESTMGNSTYWFWYKQAKYASFFNLLVLALWWQQFIFNNVKPSLSDYFQE